MAKTWDGSETWTSGERLGRWPKVRLRVSEIVICESGIDELKR